MRKFIYPLLISMIFISSGCKSGSNSSTTVAPPLNVEDVATNSGNLTSVSYSSHIFNIYSPGYTGTRNILGTFAISHDGKYAYLPYVVDNSNGTQQIGAFYYSIDANGRLVGVGGNTYLPKYDPTLDTSAYVVTNPKYDNYVMFSPSNGTYFGCINSNGSMAQGALINPNEPSSYGVLFHHSGQGFWAIERSIFTPGLLGVNYYSVIGTNSCPSSYLNHIASTFDGPNDNIHSQSQFNQNFTIDSNLVRRMAEFTYFQFYVANGNAQIVSYNRNQRDDALIFNQYTYQGDNYGDGGLSSKIVTTPNRQYAYMLNIQHGIDVLHIEQANGNLHKKFAYYLKQNPTDFIMSPDGNHLYVLYNEYKNPAENILSSFQINSDGSLTRLADRPFKLSIPNDTLRGLSITPDGRNIYIASKLGEIFEFYIGFEGHEDSINYAKTTGSNPSAMEFSANGKYVYVTNFNDGTISQFGYNAGILTTLPKLPGNGANPAGITIDGDNVYIANSGSDTISLYTGGNEGALVHVSDTLTVNKVDIIKIQKINGIKYAFVAGYGAATTVFSVASNGALSRLNSVSQPTLTSSLVFAGKSAAFEDAVFLQLDASKNSLNTIDFGSNGIATLKNPFVSGGFTSYIPAAMAINTVYAASGANSSVYVASIYDNTILEFSFERNVGLNPIGATGSVAAGGAPRDIVVSPDGKNVYVADFAGQISQYSVSKRDGHLIPLITPMINAIPNPTAIKISPDGNYVLVLSRSNDKLKVYQINK